MEGPRQERSEDDCDLEPLGTVLLWSIASERYAPGMNWKLANLTEVQQRAITHYGYVGAFWSVLLPRLIAAEPPKAEPLESPSELEHQSTNPYIPLAHRR